MEAAEPAAVEPQIWIAVAIMLAAGILGAFVNYFQLKVDERKEAAAKTFFVAITAAALIPVFLSTISSELVSTVMNAGSKQAAPALELFGFCVLAAIASNRFIQSLSESVLKRLDKTEEETAQLKTELKDVEGAVDAIQEPDTPPAPGAVSSGAIFAALTTTPMEAETLKAIKQSKFALRSVHGLSAQLKTDKLDVQSTLLELQSKGLVFKVVGKKGERWGLTTTGAASI